MNIFTLWNNIKIKTVFRALKVKSENYTRDIKFGLQEEWMGVLNAVTFNVGKMAEQ